MSASLRDLSTLLQGLRDAGESPGSDLCTTLVESAEAHLAGAVADQDTPIWQTYLELTRYPRFLLALPDDAWRLRWAETTFAVIEATGFNLGDLLEQRVREMPDRVLFRDRSEAGGESWTYRQIQRRVRAIAAVLLEQGHPEKPPTDPVDDVRVALLCENGIDTACCDLACLTNEILVTPLNVHFSTANLAWIFDRLRITAAVCDDPDRLEKLLAVREMTREPFAIFTLNNCNRAGADDIHMLERRTSLLHAEDVADILARRPRRRLRDVTTVMFTSGSTGRPKGVAFSQYNLVTKRFARSAALPEVGRDEVMLCYLPLYHTFGRYLEMLGSIYWGGTYVFAGNKSADTLISDFAEIRPTALISVPVRWVQIRDRVLELANAPGETRPQQEIFREVVGDRFNWGLSAAGYLDPKVFRFYHRNGVQLCSGFGMTEGTGGLTMTPPYNYVEGSVGIPLPGVAIRFADQGELQIAGPYIARYLPEDDAPGALVVEDPDTDTHWLATGDLFIQNEQGHLEIVDRIKDIYKNNRGQTIAPRKVESIFEGVPGIKRTFLAGDGRSFNTLLIVPDPDSEVLQTLTADEDRHEYFQRIVTTANPGLASYDRVVNFAVLDRDFSLDKDELTPKGSYRRKVIEKNFAPVISGLYQSNTQVLTVGPYEVRIPRWVFRDLGVLENAITVTDGGLVCRESNRRLDVFPGQDGRVRIGDLEYRLDGGVIDLGLMSRQPQLWMANPQVTAFCPCRKGWDTGLQGFAEQVFLPDREDETSSGVDFSQRVDRDLDLVNTLCCRALFGTPQAAVPAIAELDEQLSHVGVRQGTVIRRRLEALAHHPVKEVRCRAYQVLVLDQPVPDYLRYLPAFIESGLPFLDEESFQAISRASIEPRRLLAFRQRLHSYRDQLPWPAPERTRQLFADLFRLLADFGRYHPEFYSTIRMELVSWVLHREDPDVAEAAAHELNDLSRWFEETLEARLNVSDKALWDGKIVFQEGLSEPEVRRLQDVLIGTAFLQESILLAFEGEEVSLDEVGPGDIWVSRIISRYEESRYRLSLNTKSGKHFDLQLIIRQEGGTAALQETIFWYIALRGYPFGTPMLPDFGCFRPELGALSMAYTSDLTVWEKIREFSSVRGPGTAPPTLFQWNQLMVRAISVVVKGWRNSGKRIIPGLVTPNNIVVPLPDYRKGAVQNNLTGWRPYTGPMSLVLPLWRNMYQHTISHYPWTRDFLDRQWIFDGIVEALDVNEALPLLRDLQRETAERPTDEMGLGFNEALADFIQGLETRFYQPLALKAAMARFEDWERSHAQAPLTAKLEIIEDMSRLYRLDTMGETVRLHLFRGTYWRDADIKLLDVFDRMLVRKFRHPERRVVNMVELSEFQACLSDPDDRLAFNRMAFPYRQRDANVEVRTLGDPERSQVQVRSTIRDRQGRSFTVSRPGSPAEVGTLYSLFLQAGFPKSISETDRYFVVTDEAEQIIGGVVYRPQGDGAVFLDGIVVSQQLLERGITSAVLEDFCTRMKSRGNSLVKTHFFLRRFYQRHGFRMDSRWGGLVRHL